MSRLLCVAAFAAALQPPPRAPEPPRIEKTANYKAAAEASARLAGELKAPPASRKTVAVVGGGLSGLACGKYLSDAGHEATVYEARDVLGGKVSAWQDDDGDWIETGLHVFFGAYPNVLNLFKELDIRDRLQWKAHRMSFAMRERPGEFTSFEFPEGVPAPLNMAAAILTNTEMLSLSFIDEQDELSVLQFMEKYGMPDTINEEIFIAMGKALDFIDPDKLSMTVVLAAMNRFINEADGSQTAFLDGNQPERVCAPMADRIRDAGATWKRTPLAEISVNDDGGVAALVLKDGREVVADEYVLAMPVDVTKRLIPEAWSTMPFFRQLDALEGIPVINIQLWFDAKFDSLDGLAFSRSPLLSVYADMSRSCAEYADDDRSMLELVFAPCAPEAGSPVNWLAKPDDDVVAATLDELKQLFPADMEDAKLLKSAVVRTPRSVWRSPPQQVPAVAEDADPEPHARGCYTSQVLGSMEARSSRASSRRRSSPRARRRRGSRPARAAAARRGARRLRRGDSAIAAAAARSRGARV
ncbi:oxidoreductase [Aureococcus anophagefferens]|nr:oxidoreductase [Aureococcus anophagefferens]